MRRRRTGAFHADSVEDYLEKVKESDNMAAGAAKCTSPTHLSPLEDKSSNVSNDQKPYLDLKQMISRSSTRSSVPAVDTDKTSSQPQNGDNEQRFETSEHKSPTITPVEQDCLSSDPETTYVEALIVKIMVMGTQEAKCHKFIHSLFPGGEFHDECLAIRNPLDFVVKIDKGDDKTVNYHFWVKECNRESELERFKCIYSTYYKSVSSFIFVYNIYDMDSFTAIKYSIQEVKRVISKEFKGILIGLMIPGSPPVARKVKFEEGQNLADEEGLREVLETDLTTILVNKKVIRFISSVGEARQSKLKLKKP